MADSYKAEGSLIRDYNKLSQEHKESLEVHKKSYTAAKSGERSCG